MQFWLRKKFLPHLTVIGGNLEKARNAARVSFSPKSYAGENEPANNRQSLQSGEPIRSEAMQPIHVDIIACVSSSNKSAKVFSGGQDEPSNSQAVCDNRPQACNGKQRAVKIRPVPPKKTAMAGGMH